MNIFERYGITLSEWEVKPNKNWYKYNTIKDESKSSIHLILYDDYTTGFRAGTSENVSVFFRGKMIIFEDYYRQMFGNKQYKNLEHCAHDVDLFIKKIDLLKSFI